MRGHKAYTSEAAAQALERVAAHLKTTARHYRQGEVPPACAHAFAAFALKVRSFDLATLKVLKAEPLLADQGRYDISRLTFFLAGRLFAPQSFYTHFLTSRKVGCHDSA